MPTKKNLCTQNANRNEKEFVCKQCVQYTVSMVCERKQERICMRTETRKNLHTVSMRIKTRKNMNTIMNMQDCFKKSIISTLEK